MPIVVDIDATQGAGARLVCNFVGDADKARIGMKIKVIWTSVKDGWELPNIAKA